MIGTAIEWADDTVNPWWGCAKVSRACGRVLDGRTHDEVPDVG